jgi:hypothetical protein
MATVLSCWILGAPSTNPDPPTKYIPARAFPLRVFRNARRFIMLPWISGAPPLRTKPRPECIRHPEITFCVAPERVPRKGAAILRRWGQRPKARRLSDKSTFRG